MDALHIGSGQGYPQFRSVQWPVSSPKFIAVHVDTLEQKFWQSSSVMPSNHKILGHWSTLQIMSFSSHISGEGVDTEVVVAFGSAVVVVAFGSAVVVVAFGSAVVVVAFGSALVGWFPVNRQFMKECVNK